MYTAKSFEVYNIFPVDGMGQQTTFVNKRSKSPNNGHQSIQYTNGRSVQFSYHPVLSYTLSDITMITLYNKKDGAETFYLQKADIVVEIFRLI